MGADGGVLIWRQGKTGEDLHSRPSGSGLAGTAEVGLEKRQQPSGAWRLSLCGRLGRRSQGCPPPSSLVTSWS